MKIQVENKIKFLSSKIKPKKNNYQLMKQAIKEVENRKESTKHKTTIIKKKILKLRKLNFFVKNF